MKMKSLKMMLASVMAIAMCTALTGCGEKSFNVTDTMEITFEGCNGYGVCVLENEYAWIADVVDWYGDTINDAQRASCEAQLMETVTYEMTPAEGLTNGDIVTITANIGSAAEEYAFALKSEEMTVTVEGLEDAETFDPFTDITIVFEGIAPNGTASVKTEGSNSDISYELDQNTALSNGDTVTVTAVPACGMNEYAKKYGKVFSADTKTFTVEGLTSYASSIDEISDEMKDKIQQQASDSIQASCASWAEGNSLKESEFLGYYFLTSKDGFAQKPTNEIYCVYKMTANLTGLKRGGDGVTEETGEEIYYTYYRYTDVMLLPDGTCSLDLSTGELCDNHIESDYGYNDFWVGAVFYYFEGYEDLDSMFNHCVTEKIGTYDYESTVQ